MPIPLTSSSSCAPPRAVVVDDEPALAALVASYLAKDGFDVRQALDGPTGLATIREHDPDVIVLDVALPGMDGIEVARQTRTFTDAYVIMLTARAEEVDMLIGLSVGADDYMTKPFSPRELTARVRALLRRPRGGIAGRSSHQQPTMTFGPLTIDVAGREAAVDGSPVALTRTEFDLLAALAARPELAMSRRALIEVVWGPEWVGDEHLVDVHLLHVRRKLGDSPAAQR
ncbi:MAG: response regulator transcription factor, partial [Bifidobacteriaceae bacterium]|nr:response regulator transcription factor [Bifidobacteriaceae bacterium]